MERIIKSLNTIGADYFNKSFKFIQNSNVYIAKSDNMSFAINKKKNQREQIKVISWLEDFWIYIEIQFFQAKNKKDIPNIIFSLSVFQGESTDPIKLQLFRAEWDSHEEYDSHPQPHWHIFDKKNDLHAETFQEIIGQEENNFEEYLKEGGNMKMDLDRFHFAMNGQWSNSKADFHTIQKDEEFFNWFKGLLHHLKKELLYVKRK